MSPAFSPSGKEFASSLRQPGQLFFGVSMMAFGIQHWIYAGGMAGPVPGPPWTIGTRFWAGIVGVALVAAGISIAVKKKARFAATAVALLLFLYALLLNVPRLIASFRNPGQWTGAFELLAMCGAALAMAADFPVEWPNLEARNKKTARLGGFVFAMALVVFGIQHFQYARFIAGLIPRWIPGHLFWAYFVGAAFFATAIAIATGKTARLAGALLGTMFLLWVLILHLPRVVAVPYNGNEWTSALIALAMSGGALALAGSEQET